MLNLPVRPADTTGIATLVSSFFPAVRRLPLPRRLWLGGAALALFIVTFIVGNGWIAPDRALTRHMIGFDYVVFHAAGTFARERRFDALYDLPAIADEEHQIGREAGLDMSTRFGPYWNPPVFAWVFAPLSALPFHTALDLWLVINAAALGLALLMLARMLPPGTPAGHKGLLVLLVLICMPVIQAFSHAQNTCISLLIVTAVVTLWRRDPVPPASASPGPFRRACLAGALAGLLSYKPQLAAVVGAVLILDLGLPALLGMAATGAILLALTLVSMPGLLNVYWHRLPSILHFMQVDHAYLWDRHVTLKAFWRLLFQGDAAGADHLLPQLLTALTTLAVAALLLRALWRARAGLRLLPPSWRSACGLEAAGNHALRREPFDIADRLLTRDRLIAATIAAMPLLMPFYFDYDLLLLAIPATLFARERLLSEPPAALTDRWLTRAWMALYAWLLVNPGIARLTHVNLTVPLLAVTATLLIVRATAARHVRTPAPAPARESLAAA